MSDPSKINPLGSPLPETGAPIGAVPETKFFFDLTPERILRSVEAVGFRTTGRCLTLNSMENRVYEVEIEVQDEASIKRPADKFRVVKFYRPGRWSPAQILEEHEFLLDLAAQDIPVVTPLAFSDGTTLKEDPEINIYFAVFQKIGGRNPDELDDEKLERLGRLLARVHTVGAAKDSPNRIQLSPTNYGLENLNYLREAKILPPELTNLYFDTANSFLNLVTPWFSGVKLQRIHGDCHLGNVLWGNDGPFLVDFDDMVRGPCVQDFWLLIAGQDAEAYERLEKFLTAYEQIRIFDRNTLRLIEPLRTLRYIHYATWIARRWEDPIFKQVFPHFGSEVYWRGQVVDLQQQMRLIQAGGHLAWASWEG